MTSLSAHNVRLAYGQQTVSPDLSVIVPEGKVTVLIGPNGSGKSTLLRALSGLHAPAQGQIRLGERDLYTLKPRELAGHLAILVQQPTAPGSLKVRELVEMGRHPHRFWHQRWSEADERAVQLALTQTGMAGYQDRALMRLSGGQQQRAWIALVLAQQTPTLLLDEPTTFLDISHQLEVLDLIRDLNRSQGKTVVMVLHDLNQAAAFADDVVVMKEGQIANQGKPQDIFTAALLRDVFRLEAEVINHPRFEAPVCLPVRSVPV
jgi:iron complex transport system ATP-binding protein